MKLFLFGGRAHGEKYHTDLPFVEGDAVVWTPEQHLSRIPGPHSPAHRGYVISDFHVIDEEGVEHRRAEWNGDTD